MADRQVEAVASLVAAGRLDEASAVAQAALDTGHEDARLRLALSSILLVSGHAGDAVQEAEAVLQRSGLSDELHAAAAVSRLLGLLVHVDGRGARAAAENLLAGDGRPPSDAELAAALTAMAFLAWEDGRMVDALGLVRAAVRRADHLPPDAGRTHPRVGEVAILIAAGELDGAARAVDALVEEIDRTADTAWLAVPPVLRGRLDLVAGRLDDAVREAEAALDLAEASGASLWLPQALSTLAIAALNRGRLDEAAEYVHRYRAEPPVGRVLFGYATFLWVEARLAEVRCGPERAVDLLAPVYDDLSHHGRLVVEEPAAAAWLVRAALTVGEQYRAHDVAAWAQQLAATNEDLPPVRAAADHAHGLLRRDPAALVRAAEGQRSPWARASALEDAGVVVADEGDATGAVELLEAARATYEEAGATRDVARVEGRLRDRRIGSGRRRSCRPVSGWGSLTDAERRVARSVAEGLTNAEVGEKLFLSRHTVDFHLRQIFRKLGIRSRVELTRLVLENGPATGRTPSSGREAR